ncbi:hypothetical protein [Desmospora profundinema]|uniref:Uncharacterized protein YjfI (DUF2170 family) n=1 Tax=Desmospora profundinema TaxID=1571184 RepID=A0ABU1III8_9BACL|nr:hypothetical protein [Desmospora profundinema]MDR6224208.1 uncharacterized protein YjfI (DUF2170 family) [Desmospora profundinema]
MNRMSGWLIIMLLILTSCSSSDIEIKRGLIGIIYTDALKDDSEFVTFDKNGNEYSNARLKEMGIFEIEQNEAGDIILPVQFGDSVININSSGKITSNKTLEFPLFVREENGLRISTYNTHLDYGTLEIVNGKQSKQIKLDGFLRIATSDSNNIYVFATIIDKAQPVFYVIDRKNNELDKQIPLKIDLANDLKLIENTLLIGSTDDQNKIAMVNTKNWKVEYLELPFDKPEYFIEETDTIVVTHQNQKNVSILNKDTLDLQTTKKIKFPVFKVDSDENHYYFLTQRDNKDSAGVVCVYDKSNWELVDTITLPVKRNTLVQDIKIIQ